ncbi:MAG: PAS domain S-box protein [Candidatus Heimdallarchaeota archaeon]|nr:PAS domain S-box protein [Candidatus Heimdallarchaeota archaeon]MCK5048207.1 PAS domain S-box protein [Candidatus Heimdallarchaeota archaeon]
MTAKESKNYKILYVDDELGLLDLAKTFLEKENIEVITSNSSYESLERITDLKFDGIISDYQMPEMNGLELLTAIRSKGVTKPFIIFTGKGREDVAIDALNLGADRYIQKGSNLRTQYSILAQAIKNEITRWRSQEELKQREEEYRSLVENINVGVYRSTPDGKILQANSAFLKMFGFKSLSEVQEISVYDLYEMPPLRNGHLQELKEIATQKRNELKLKKRDGSSFWASDSVRATFDDSGNFLWMDGILEDISDHKELENTFLINDKNYLSFLNYIPFAVFMIDVKGTIQFLNTKNADIAKCDYQELIGKNVYDFIISEKRTQLSKKTLEMSEGEVVSHEVNLLRIDNTSFKAEIWITKIQLQDKEEGFIGIAREIPN